MEVSIGTSVRTFVFTLIPSRDPAVAVFPFLAGSAESADKEAIRQAASKWTPQIRSDRIQAGLLPIGAVLAVSIFAGFAIWRWWGW